MGDVKGFPTLKLLLNFDCKIACIIKGKVRLKVYLVCSSTRGQLLNEPGNFELQLFIQGNPHFEFFKLSNVLFYLKILLAKRYNL